MASRLLATLACVAACRDRAATTHADRLGLPPIMLWAWERPEDLRFVDVGAIGVAPLVATITLAGGETFVRPRRQPLQVPPSAAVLPVVRIEVTPRIRPSLDDAQRAQVLDALAAFARPAHRLQIDFEATSSQRDFYRALVHDLRARLGPTFPLSATALASWCLGDRWLAGVPLDEVVPMYYRLGPRAREAAEMLEREGDFAAPECRHAIGLALDEPQRPPPGWPPTPRRRYLFSPRAFSPAQVSAATRPAGPATGGGAAPERAAP